MGSSRDFYDVPNHLREELSRKLAGLRPPEEHTRFDPRYTEEIYLPVDDGEIRVIHHRPPEAATVRPILFIPGWGTVEEGFRGFFNVVDTRAECYYLETREKNSSRLDRKRARLDMSSKARDIARAIKQLGLGGGKDFLLVGTCWGSAVIAHGLIEGILSAPTVLLFDPMHTLWFPKWILRYIAPLTPIGFWRMVRPLAKRIALSGMNEAFQRRRTELFIDGAEIWKWKRCAQAVREFELYGRLGRVEQEVLILNGVKDKIHEQEHYPRLAAELPRGRFFHLPVDEKEREELIALAALEFAAQPGDAPAPEFIGRFEKAIDRST